MRTMMFFVDVNLSSLTDSEGFLLHEKPPLWTSARVRSAFLADINGDGFAEAIVGYFDDCTPDCTAPGRASVYYGNSTAGTAAAHREATNTASALTVVAAWL